MPLLKRSNRDHGKQRDRSHFIYQIYQLDSQVDPRETCQAAYLIPLTSILLMASWIRSLGTVKAIRKNPSPVSP